MLKYLKENLACKTLLYSYRSLCKSLCQCATNEKREAAFVGSRFSLTDRCSDRWKTRRGRGSCRDNPRWITREQQEEK